MGSRSFNSSRTASSSGEVTEAMRGGLGFRSEDTGTPWMRLRLHRLRLYDPSALIASISKGFIMDLGIRGRTAIVCASSQGLGKGCAHALAEAGVNLVINGRNQALLEQTAQELRQAWSVSVTPVLADVSTAEGQAA